MPRKRKYFTEEQRILARREIRRRSAKKCYDADPEKARKIRREWARRNREKLRPLWALRDKRKRCADGIFAVSDIDRIYQSQRGRCAICRAALGPKYHRDHIIPLVKGGSNWPTNIQLLCPPCNLSKGSKDPIEHMRSLGRLL